MNEYWTVKVRETAGETIYKFIDRGSALSFAETMYQMNKICWVIGSNNENPSR